MMRLSNQRLSSTIVVAVLAVLIIAVYTRVGTHNFSFDDDLYVLNNPDVRAGLTQQGFLWAFSTFHASNWHPLTWLSLMADVSLFGVKPGAMHLVNLCFHLLNALLLFLVLRKATGDVWKSSFVAALFGVHPLHVESVAWVSERKDVLSALSFMLTLWAYVLYARRPSIRRFLPIFLFLALGLLSKPMLVTLPFVLLLLDYWPLERLKLRGTVPEALPQEIGPVSLGKVLLEKVPLLILSAASCVVTSAAQREEIAVAQHGPISFGIRLSNAALSYVAYLWKALWPQSLAAFYPHSGKAIPAWDVALSVLLLLAASFCMIRTLRVRRYLAVGWFWFLGMLIPVIGLVQVGDQAMADRYMYLPAIGIYLMAAWGVPEAFPLLRIRKQVLAILASFVVIALSVVAWVQVGYWRNNLTLFSHAAAVTRGNAFVYNNLGSAFLEVGLPDNAIVNLKKALAIDPRRPETLYNIEYAMGEVHFRDGDFEAAASRFRRARWYRPGARVCYKLALALDMGGKATEAIPYYRESLRLDSANAKSHTNLAVILYQLGHRDDALIHFFEAARIDPSDVQILKNLGVALMNNGRLEEATAQFRKALELRPSDAEASALVERIITLSRKNGQTTSRQ